MTKENHINHFNQVNHSSDNFFQLKIKN